MSSPDELFALDCELGSEAPGAAVYSSALLVALLPIMLVGVSVGVCYLIARFREEERGKNLSRNLCVSIVLVLFLLHLPARHITHCGAHVYVHFMAEVCFPRIMCDLHK